MLDRRRTLALGAAVVLGACRGELMTRTTARPIDKARLSAGFQPLAARARPGVLALGVMSLDDAAQSWSSDNTRTFPLAGAAAAPIAASVLALVDAGELALTQRIGFDSADLSPPPSSIDQRWPDPPQNRAATIRLAGLCTLALQAADNTAVDVLLNQAGGPGGVTAFLEAKRVTGLSVDRYQRQIAADRFGMPTFRPAWKDPAPFLAALAVVPPDTRRAATAAFIADARDATTVPAALGFLDALADGRLISTDSLQQLLGWMRGVADSRLRPGLPADARLAAATGATLTDLGVTAATAELAIASWPGGSQYALAAFLAGSTAADADRAALFADAARLVAATIGGA